MSVLHNFINTRWYGKPGVLLLLLPLEWLFSFVACWRRKRLQSQQPQLDVPVIIVGNISVGGTGKTPVLIALTESLLAHGKNPGIISRGYGRVSKGLTVVGDSTSPVDVGDEPQEIFVRTGVPVVVSENRLQAARYLIENGRCDVILSDDGLQHYRLPRVCEIAVVDGERLFGNGHCLPVGPLREPVQRLASIDHIMVNGSANEIAGAMTFTVEALEFENVMSGECQPLGFMAEFKQVVAIAGIGNPQKFFKLLAALQLNAKLQIRCKSFADHHDFSQKDLEFAEGEVVIMTAKDAVKCRAFARSNWWYLKVRATLPPAVIEHVLSIVDLYSESKNVV